MRARLVAGMVGAGALVASLLGVGVPAAYAACYGPSCTPPSVPSNPPTQGLVHHDPTPTSTSGGLPFTGADIAGMSAVGLGAVGLGSVLVVRSRRRARPSAA
jgi:hypothetical protein